MDIDRLGETALIGLAAELLDIAALAAKLKIAESKCRNLHDYFHLIQGVSGALRCRNVAPIQKETEVVPFLLEVCKLPIRSALEIGTANGGTFYLLCKVAERNATLLTIDLENDWRRAALLRSYGKLGQKTHIIAGNSYDERILQIVRRALGSRSLDLLFIDGDHSLAGVSRDFTLYSGLVRPGGMIAMHDIIPDYRTRYGIMTPNYAGDVPRFWQAIKSNWRAREFVESYSQDAYGVGVIRWDPTVRTDLVTNKMAETDV